MTVDEKMVTILDVDRLLNQEGVLEGVDLKKVIQDATSTSDPEPNVQVDAA